MRTLLKYSKIFAVIALFIAPVVTVIAIADSQFISSRKKVLGTAKTHRPPTLTAIPSTASSIEIKKEPTVYKQLSAQHIAPTTILTFEPTVTPTIQKPDNRAKLDAIANQFKKIGDLNTQIVTYQLLANDAASTYICNPDDYAHIFNPFDRDALYQQCLSNKSSIVGTYMSHIEGAKNQIRDINNQIQGVIATCSGSECSDYYWELVNGFEAKGLIVR
jgi:hypothetical protein